MAADRLFESLQGRDVAAGGRTWRVEIYSISDVGPVRWIQLALNGLPRHMLVLKLAAGSGVRPVLRAVSSWLANPSAPSASVINGATSAALRLTAHEATS